MSANKDSGTLVEAVQAESEATGDRPLPETVRGERRGRSVVQSVRLPAEDFADIVHGGTGEGAGRGADPRLGAGRAGR